MDYVIRYVCTKCVFMILKQIRVKNTILLIRWFHKLVFLSSLYYHFYELNKIINY